MIDGVLSEACWQQGEVADQFFQNFPADTSYALSKTEVMVSYDDQNLYIAARCFDELDGPFVVQSLKRDFDYSTSDAFAVCIDPFNDKVNGFYFAVNPMGVQAEGLIEGTGPRAISLAWDNKWTSEVKQFEGGWSVEMAIPYKTLRFKEGIAEWSINFARNDLKRNENSSWSAVPRNFAISTLVFGAPMRFEEAPKKAGGNVSLIPYAIGGVSQDYAANEEANVTANVGGDAKVAVSPSLNLDLTVNPDFSQVEVDRQQTNLTRFSLFFPERRQFFIENSDLFSQFGFSRIRPFFSRRIGLQDGQPVPIIAGARLSGKLTPGLRIGAMNMQTAAESSLDLEAQNYSVAVFQQKVFGESFIGGVFVNRQGFEGNDISSTDYNRIIGMDYNIVTKDNRLRGKVFYHHSLQPDVNTRNYAHASWLFYSTENIFAMWNHEFVGKNYVADVGFVPRNRQFNFETGEYVPLTYWRLEPIFNYIFYPKGSSINNIEVGARMDQFMNADFEMTDLNLRPKVKVFWENTAFVEAGYTTFFTKLLFDTDVTFSGNELLPAGDYWYEGFDFSVGSNLRKPLNGSFTVGYGSYYNGTRLNFGSNIFFRKQPWGIFSLQIDHNQIRLPDPYSDADITLIGPKVELSFSKSVFWTIFTQYNTQAENLNINTRLQWRFRPMSDLYLVYTDNYDPLNIAIQNRAVVLKLIYWLNL